MSFIRRLGKILVVAGIASFVGATAWWYLFFETLLGESVKEARTCFYQTTASCEVGNLAGLFSDVPVYSPLALWISVGLFVIGGLVYGLSSGGAGDESS